MGVVPAYADLCHTKLELATTQRATAGGGTQAYVQPCRRCAQSHSRGSARPATTPAPRVWSRTSYIVCSRRRSRRSRRRRGRVSRSRVALAAAAALHREEPGEPEDEEVERADRHLLSGEVENETR